MNRVFSVVVLLSLMCAPVFGIPLLGPGDSVIAIDPDPHISNSGYPAGEAPPNALDNNANSKYLNYAGAGSGFIVTQSAAAQVRSFTLTTAGDVEGRDPTSWKLYGTNDAINSADNSTGLAENWTPIDSGMVSLPSARNTLGPVITVNNSGYYTSYRMVYPDLKGDPLMQVADVAFYETTNGTGTSVLSALDPILAIHDLPDSRYPAVEGPANLVDGTLGKYLNFGKERSGFIITPASGPSIVDSFQITTANDWEERDPASWLLFGTNDPISSADNGAGTDENWMLIDGGSLSLPSDRDTLGSMVAVTNSTVYTSYKLMFPSLKDTGATDSMQIAEIQFYGVPEPATICLLGLGALGLLRKRRL